MDNNNKMEYKEQYVTLTDIKTLNPCWFKDKKNPLTEKHVQAKMDFKIDMTINIRQIHYHLV